MQKISGKINITKSGIGFVETDKLKNSILIEPEHLSNALDGDEVLVSLTRAGLKPKGIVTEVTKRLRDKFVGVIEQESNQFYLIPDNKRIHTDILLIPNKYLKRGKKAFVKIINWEPPMPKGKLLKILGDPLSHKTEMQSILLENNISSDFPNEVLSQASKLEKIYSGKKIDLQKEKREDFRSKTTFTIDPDSAKDFDDALSVDFLQNGEVEIGVHIADVTFFVKANSKIDKEAQKRATSVYLPDETIPMLPEVLSNDLCSLNENEDKRAFSVVFVFDQNLNVKSYRFVKTVINSNKRFTYKEAQNVLDKKSDIFQKELLFLNKLSKKIKQERLSLGGIEFQTDEIEIILDKKKRPIDIHIKESLQSMRLIEEFMLLANRYVATFLSENSNQETIIYRIHEKPDPEKLAELNIFLRALGYEHLNKQNVTSKDIAKLLKDAAQAPEYQSIQNATLRTMAKAVYSDKNMGHFSLAFAYYTHFTSPIRRYPDIMVHRLLESKINNKSLSRKEYESFRKLAIHSTKKEIKATDSEREAIKYKQIEFMQDKIGQTFDGMITGVLKSGIFIKESKTGTEGFVKREKLSRFIFDENKYAFVSDKESYSIGTKLKVKLLKADIQRREIDWEII